MCERPSAAPPPRWQIHTPLVRQVALDASELVDFVGALRARPHLLLELVELFEVLVSFCGLQVPQKASALVRLPSTNVLVLHFTSLARN